MENEAYRPTFGIDAGNDREGDCLGNECKCDDEPGQKVALDVAEPFGFECTNEITIQVYILRAADAWEDR